MYRSNVPFKGFFAVDFTGLKKLGLPRAAIVLALSSVVLTGCFQKTRESSVGVEEEASFQVVSLSDAGTTKGSVDPKWQITKQQFFKFQVCIKSIVDGTPVRDHRFVISDRHGRRIDERPTDPASGCLTWAEPTNFEPFLIQPTYLTLTRKITADGKQRGTATFTIGANPWSGIIGNERPVLDLTFAKETAPRLLNEEDSEAFLAGKMDGPGEANIYIPSIKHEIASINATNGLTPTLWLTFSPQIQVKLMTGATDYIPLQQGVLQIQNFGVLKSDSDKAVGQAHTQLHQPLQTDVIARVEGNQTRVPIVIPFDEAPRPPGYFDIAFRVAPTADAPRGLRAKEAYYHVGTAQQLAAGSSSLSNDAKAPDFQVNSTLKIGVTKSTGQVVSAIKSDPFAAPPVPRGPAVINGFNQIQRIQFSTKLRWSHTDVALEYNRAITITPLIPGSKPIAAKTRAGGEVTWEDQLSRDVYGCHKRNVYSIIITDEATHSSTLRQFELDPQDFSVFNDLENQGGKPSPDVYGGGCAQEKRDAYARSTPRFKLESGVITFRQMKYSIDDLLNLTQMNRYHLELTGEVLRPDHPTKGSEVPTDSLPMGRYLVSMLVYAPADVRVVNGVDQAVPVVAAQKVVDYSGGGLQTEIILPYQKLSHILLKNYLVVQLTPLDDSLQSPVIDPDSIDPRTAKVRADMGVAFPAYVSTLNGATTSKDSLTIDVYPGTRDPRSLILYKIFSGTSAHDVASKFSASSNRAQVEEKVVAEGWKVRAQQLGMKPVLVDNDQAVDNELRLNMRLEQLAQSLECWDKHSWADDADRAKCIVEPLNQQVGAAFCELLQVDAKSLEDCKKNPSELLRVQDRKFVYRLAGFRTIDQMAYSFGISNSFTMGKVNFTDYGKMDISAFTMSIAGGLGREFSPVRWLGGSKPSVGGEAAVAKNYWSVQQKNNREVNDNDYSFASSLSLTVVRKNFELSLDYYRQCYFVHARKLPRENEDYAIWVKQKVGLAPKSGTLRIESAKPVMLCFAPWKRASDEHPMKALESYFDIYTPPTSAATIDQTKANTRLMIPLRGERDFYWFIDQLNRIGSPFKVNGTPIEISKMLKSKMERLAQKVPMEEGELASQAPSRNDTFETFRLREVNWDPLNNFNIPNVEHLNSPSLRQDLTTRNDVHDGSSRQGD